MVDRLNNMIATLFSRVYEGRTLNTGSRYIYMVVLKLNKKHTVLNLIFIIHFKCWEMYATLKHFDSNIMIKVMNLGS